MVLVGPLCPGKLFGHEIFVGQGLVREFEFSKISRNIDTGGLSREEKSRNSLADANFNALRRRPSHLQLYVAWGGLGSHRPSNT